MSRIAGNIALFKDEDAIMSLAERTQTLYFHWLCSLVRLDNYCEKSWYILAKLLHNIEFYWTIPNDDNRATDGVKLREVWYTSIINEAEDLGVGMYVDTNALNGPCTVLEMLIGLAIRIEADIMQNDAYGNRTYRWFWRMIGNLYEHRLGHFGDSDITSDDGDFITAMTMKCLDRDYFSDGSNGGLFPLFEPVDENQRETELWYQAQNWLKEAFPEEF